MMRVAATLCRVSRGIATLLLPLLFVHLCFLNLTELCIVLIRTLRLRVSDSWSAKAALVWPVAVAVLSSRTNTIA